MRYVQLPLVKLWWFNTIMRALENEMTAKIRRNPAQREEIEAEFNYLMEMLRRESKEVKVE